MSKVRLNSLLAVSITAVLLANTPVVAQEKSLRAVRFDIEQQPLATAINLWAQQAGLQVMWPADDEASGIISTSVQGRLDPIQALDVLLRNTGLTYSLIDDGRTVAIHPATQSAGMQTTAYSREGGGAGTTGIQLAVAEEPIRPTSSATTDVKNLESLTDSTEEIVVTGTHIRGNNPIGSRVTTIGREEIESSGYGRFEDFVQVLPQNFSGASEDFNQTGISNLNRGHEIQLRGLGTGTTLFLVNGQRQPAGGVLGAFVDISSIPTAAIERVEVLSDGASALYGSDAVGGVVNVILRRDLSGAETSVRLAGLSGERGEQQVAQLFGTRWDDGNVLIGYQYQKSDPLYAADRDRTALNVDFTSLGGTDFRQTLRLFNGSPGTILSPTTGLPAYAIPANQDGRGLRVSDLIAGQTNYTDNVTGTSILPEQKLHTGFLHVSQDIGAVNLSFDGRYAKREMEVSVGPQVGIANVPATNPFYVNPFGTTGNVRVAYNFSSDLGISLQEGETETSAGLLAAAFPIAGSWRGRFAIGYGREHNAWVQSNMLNTAALGAALAITDPATSLNVFGSGSSNAAATLDRIRTSRTSDAVTNMNTANLVLDGSAFSTWAGSSKVAVGVDARQEKLSVATATRGRLREDRQITAAFGEISLPLLSGGDKAKASLPGLEVSASGRYEEYDDFGHTLDPRVGITWRPFASTQLRAAWGASFRAPGFYQSSELLSPDEAFSTTVVDPLSPTGSSKVIIRYGNNDQLTEETADTFSAGADIAIGSEDPISIHLSYFQIKYKGKIETVGNSNTALQRESELAPIITRDPDAQLLNQICNDPGFVVGDCSGVIAAIIDTRARNLSIVETSGIDLDVQQQYGLLGGALTAKLSGTYLLKYERALTDSSPVVDVVDTVGNPPALRLRGSLSLSKGGWAFGSNVNYTGAYDDKASVPNRRVGSFTTVDIFSTYTLPESSLWMRGLTLSLNAVNVFDEAPPFVNQTQGYDPANSWLLGRLVSLQVAKSW